MQIQRYPAGTTRYHTKPGDFILTHRNNPYAKVVRFGQRIKFRGENRIYAHWSHAALVVGYHGEIIEALARGVVLHHLSYYKDREYHYMDTKMELADRRQAADFAYASLGQRYAWLTILSLAFQTMTPDPITLDYRGTQMCSGLVARSLERGPFIWSKIPQAMLPADLAKECNIRP